MQLVTPLYHNVLHHKTLTPHSYSRTSPSWPHPWDPSANVTTLSTSSRRELWTCVSSSTLLFLLLTLPSVVCCVDCAVYAWFRWQSCAINSPLSTVHECERTLFSTARGTHANTHLPLHSHSDAPTDWPPHCIPISRRGPAVLPQGLRRGRLLWCVCAWLLTLVALTKLAHPLLSR